MKMSRDASRRISCNIRDVCRSDVIPLLTAIPHAGEAFSLEWLLEQQAAGKVDYIAALDDGMPVGQGIILWDGYEIPELRQDFPFTPVIRCVEVIENYRGRGIGSAIVDELETRARMRGYTHTSLGVMPENMYAQNLWRYLGYTGWEKGVFVTITTYERMNGENLVRQERFLPMRKRL
jgi:ribosomal protein S18 acetylase RimI-like enzyme